MIQFTVKKTPFYEESRFFKIISDAFRTEYLNCCKLQVIFKSQNKLCNNFRFKGPVLQTLTSGVVYNFQCGLGNEYYNEECVRHLVVRSG